jgi:hypothetical protein
MGHSDHQRHHSEDSSKHRKMKTIWITMTGRAVINLPMESRLNLQS